MDNAPEGLCLVVIYRGNSKQSTVFLPKTAVFSTKFSLELIFDEPVMRRALLSKKWEITLKIMAHHSSTLTRFITSSSKEKRPFWAILNAPANAHLHGCHLQQIPPVGLSIESNFGNAGSLTYQHHQSKQRLPLLLGDDEKLDKPFFLSWFYTDAIHVPEVVTSGI